MRAGSRQQATLALVALLLLPACDRLGDEQPDVPPGDRASAPGGVAPSPSDDAGGEEGGALVLRQQGKSRDEVAAAVRAAGGSIETEVPETGTFLARFPGADDAELEQIATELRSAGLGALIAPSGDPIGPDPTG